MTQPNELPFLAKLAELFRAEGDTTTADALVSQTQSTAARTISDEDHDRILRLQRKGNRLDSRGVHERAESLLFGALLLVEDALGREHIGIADHLNDLARCRFNNGDFGAALEDYRRLLRLIEQAQGTDDPLAKITRDSVETCQRRLRESNAARSLHAQVSSMVRHAQGTRGLMAAEYTNRLLHVADRLIERGRMKLGASLLERWIALRLAEAPADSELAINDIRDYAMAMWKAGEQQRAANALNRIVLLRNRAAPGPGIEPHLKQALSEWGSCLSAMGLRRSAQETAALADSIESARLEE